MRDGIEPVAVKRSQSNGLEKAAAVNRIGGLFAMSTRNSTALRAA
ncbi:MAG: hypothetical protein ACI9U2_003144 [Bradymonadia bacterium]|jgi:hypothetical protein